MFDVTAMHLLAEPRFVLTYCSSDALLLSRCVLGFCACNALASFMVSVDVFEVAVHRMRSVHLTMVVNVF